MKNFPRLFIAVTLAILLVGCATRLERLSRLQPSGDDFNSLLAQAYLAFSQSEADQYDWTDSSYFAQKGLDAANGKPIQPEELENWDLPDDVLETFTQARTLLVQMLEPDMIAKQPLRAAKALFSFDCWIEQQEENWQVEDIAACREDFYTVLDELQGISAGEILKANEEESPKKVIAQKSVVYFKFGSATLTPDAKKLVMGVIENIRKDPYEITLNGYTDPAGKLEYNLQLSKKRALAVKKLMVESGLSEEAITVFGFGPYHKAVSPEGKPIPKTDQRRVEILLDH